jgi:hypothetical protein
MPDDINVDELLEQIGAPTPPPEMEGGEPAPTEPAQQEQPVWNGQEWEFEVGGKKVVPESRDHITTWMKQGYNYSQRMGELNKTHAQRMAEAESAFKKAQETESRFKPYSEIDQYAKQNPDWWSFVEQSWQQRAQQSQLDPNLERIINPLKEELGSIKEFVGTLQEREALEAEARAAEAAQKEDQALDQEIGEIRKQHPNIDLNALDPETGKTLEWRVLKHAQENGIKSFKTAYRDLLHERLIEDAKANGRQAIAKDKETQIKKGILGQTKVPTKDLKPANTKAPWSSQEYDAQNILNEMGLGG